MSADKVAFGDVVENGWASEENPTRRGLFVRSFTRRGRMNAGLTWEITDGKGKFWELSPTGDHRITVTPAARLEALQPSPETSLQNMQTREAVGRETAEAFFNAFRQGCAPGLLPWDQQPDDVRDQYTRAAALFSSSPTVEGWQPIETAPKDGTSLLMFAPGFGLGALVLFWADGGWREPANHLRLKVEPTVWMPIPPAPTTEGK